MGNFESVNMEYCVGWLKRKKITLRMVLEREGLSLDVAKFLEFIDDVRLGRV